MPGCKNKLNHYITITYMYNFFKMCRYLFEVLSISLLLNPCVVFLKISEKKQRFRLVVFRSTIFIQRSRGKGPAIKEKRTFFGTFKFFCCHSKIIFYCSQLIEIWTYHIYVCRQVFYLGCFIYIFQKQGYFSPKIW